MRRRTVVVQQRRGPSLLGTMARTAVVAGTATAVSKSVSGSMDAKAQAQQQAALAQQQAALAQQQAAAAEQQAAVDQAVQAALAQQQAAQQAPPPEPDPAPPPAAGMTAEQRIAALQQLAQLQQQGILTDDEFAAEKARILAS